MVRRVCKWSSSRGCGPGADKRGSSNHRIRPVFFHNVSFAAPFAAVCVSLGLLEGACGKHMHDASNYHTRTACQFSCIFWLCSGLPSVIYSFGGANVTSLCMTHGAWYVRLLWGAGHTRHSHCKAVMPGMSGSGTKDLRCPNHTAVLLFQKWELSEVGRAHGCMRSQTTTAAASTLNAFML